MDRRADINAVVHAHAVGFLTLDRSGSGPSSRSAGSGTLVDFHGIRGVATAAHVAETLKTLPEVGIMRFKPGRTYEALTCRGDQLEITTVGSPPFGPDGPDLTFIRLPVEIENKFAATNAFFNSLVRARLQDQGHHRSPAELWFVTGTISEMSSSLGVVGSSSKMEHGAINGVGRIEAVEMKNGCDRLDFRIFHHEKFPAPSSYEGLSGGGLWQLGEGTGLLSRTLIGLAFYQSEQDSEGRRIVRCHGPLALHEVLYLAVLDRYLPEQAKAHREADWPDGESPYSVIATALEGS